jgi:hypothetical protein
VKIDLLVKEFLSCFRAMGKREEKKEVFAMDVIALEAKGIREELRRIADAQECICRELKRLNEFLRAPKSILITQQGESMATPNGIPVGGQGTFLATPQPAGTSFGSVAPVWTSSDTANTSLTPGADGTTVNVAAGASAPVGGSFTLTATWTATDGSGDVATGSLVVSYNAAANNNPTSIAITQTA